MDARSRLKQVILKVFPRAGEYRRRLFGEPGDARGNDRSQLPQQVRTLAARVAELEDEMQEARRLNKRIAELTDVVAEVLLPAGERDEERIRAALGRYAEGL